MDSVLWDGNKSWTKYAETYDPITVGSIDGTDTEPHDHGIIRAIYSEYVPNKKVKGKPSHTIFVARLNPRTTEVVDAIDCGYHVSQQIYFLSNKTNKDLTEKAIGRKMEKGSEDTFQIPVGVISIHLPLDKEYGYYTICNANLTLMCCPVLDEPNSGGCRTAWD